jgi:hypothetical protein
VVEGRQPGRALHGRIELVRKRQRQIVVIEQRQVAVGGLPFRVVFGDFG